MSDIFDANRRAFEDDAVVTAYAETTDLMADELMLYERWVPIGSRVLDLGVGTGRTTTCLVERAATYVGIDYARGMIDRAIALHPGIDLRVGDATDLREFHDSSFDVVVFSYNGIDCLHPDARRREGLREIRRVLKTGGTFLFASHNPRGIIDPLASRQGTVRRRSIELVVGLRRAWRLVPTEAFRTGAGYVREPVDGGLVVHMITPKRAARELKDEGFELVDVLSGRSDRRRNTWASPWYSYAAAAC